jgi:hypothetical protein
MLFTCITVAVVTRCAFSIFVRADIAQLIHPVLYAHPRKIHPINS